MYSETNYVVIMIDYLVKRGRFTSLLDILSFLQIVSTSGTQHGQEEGEEEEDRSVKEGIDSSWHSSR